METLPQQTVNAIFLGSIYSLFALGYALVFSILGVLNLAHSALFAWGAFVGLVAVKIWSLPVWLALPVAMIVAGILGVLLELVAFRPLRQRGAARIAQLISSIGAAILLVNIAQLLYQEIFGQTQDAYPLELTNAAPIVFESINVRIVPIRLLVLGIALALMILLHLMVTRTRIGQQMRAVAFNQRIASLLGINVGQIFFLTFFMAGALGGAAGMFYGMIFVNIDPFIGEDVALIGLTAIVLGGMGSIQGAVAGGFLVAFIQTASIVIGGSDYRDAIVFILLFLLLLMRPQGLFGQPEATRA